MYHPLVLLGAVLMPGPPLCSPVLYLCEARLHGWPFVLLLVPPPCSGVRCWSTTASITGFALLVVGPSPWLGVLCFCVTRLNGRVCGAGA